MRSTCRSCQSGDAGRQGRLDERRLIKALEYGSPTTARVCRRGAAIAACRFPHTRGGVVTVLTLFSPSRRYMEL